MRIITFLLIGSVFGSDPCMELCEAHGYQRCTDGSVVETDTEGNEFCSNYYYLWGLTIYGPTPFYTQRVPLEDVPRLLAEFAANQVIADQANFTLRAGNSSQAVSRLSDDALTARRQTLLNAIGMLTIVAALVQGLSLYFSDS